MYHIISYYIILYSKLAHSQNCGKPPKPQSGKPDPDSGALNL